MIKYAVISETQGEEVKGAIMCHGVYPYYEAVGVLVCRLKERLDNRVLNEGYTIGKRSEFVELESDEGLGWYVTCHQAKKGITIQEKWYILIAEENDGEK